MAEPSKLLSLILFVKSKK